MRTEHRSFTITYGKSVNRLITPIAIQPVLVSEDTPSPDLLFKTNALWDTGATVTLIQPSLFEHLKLRLYDRAGYTLINGVGGKIGAKPTILNMYLSYNFVMEYYPAYVVAFPGDADILIGMDIISMGDFAVCNADNSTSFSFAVPPFPDRVNFADKADTVNKSVQRLP